MPISITPFGNMPDGTQINRYHLWDDSGFSFDVIPYGCRMLSICVPDRNGKAEDILWGYDSLEAYRTPRDSQGAIIGRNAGRIANAEMELDGVHYALVANSGKHQLHGGTGTGACFSEKLWSVKHLENHSPSITFSLLSRDGEGGFPGNLSIEVRYSLVDHHSIQIDTTAFSDKKTILNTTSHGFFNLNGYDGGSICDQMLLIHADAWTVAVDDLPTGEIAGVAGTSLDFNQMKYIRWSEEEMPEGYNHNYVLRRNSQGLEEAAVLYDPASGRSMRVVTDQPGLQVYSAGRIPSGKIGKQGKPMLPQHAICLEAQHFPDSVHHSHFPSILLDAGEKKQTTTIYEFTAK